MPKKKSANHAAAAPASLVKKDARLAAEWKRISSAMRAHKSEGQKAWDALWESVGEITAHEPPLWTFGGFKTQADFLKSELAVDMRVATVNIRVAEHASPEQESKYTVWVLDAAISYLEATKGPLARHTPIDFDRVRIDKKPLADCTVKTIKAATQRHLKGTKKGRAQPTIVGDTLQTSFAKHSAFEAVKVHEAKGKLSFHNVPNASLKKFADVIRATKLPT